jgi:MSHA biogenesis protein MshP
MMIRSIRKSAGVALVTAIFLLVVLAGLAVAVVSLTTTQQASMTQDEQGVRAYQAAKAGIEWALYQKLQASPVVACPAASFQMPAGSLASFTVTVTCAQDPQSPLPNHYEIRATACNEPVSNACPNNAPGPDYVQRVITAQL